MVKNKKQNNKDRKIKFKDNLREYWKILRNYKSLFFWLLVVSLFVEISMIADKFIFKRIIDDGTKYLDGSLQAGVFTEVLLLLGAGFILIVIARTFTKWLSIHLLISLSTKLIYDTKQKYFNHIVGLSHNFHTTHKTGSLISRLNRGAGAVEGVTDNIVFNFAPLIFQVFLVGGSIAYFSPINSVVLFLMVFSFIAFSIYIQHIQQKHRLNFNESEDREKGFIADSMTNIDSVKYFGKEKRIENMYDKHSSRTKRLGRKYWNYFRWFDSGQILILGIGLFFLIYFPIKGFLAGDLTLGTLTFIYTAYGNLTGPLFGFVWGVRGFYREMADMQDLFEYGKYENEIKDKPDAKPIKIENGEIEFNDVSFHYGRKKAFCLEDFNLKIKPNEKVAFVGHSGCGKSTLVKLLYRLYDVQKGEILIDGIDIRNVKQKSLRSELSIVPQEAILFDDTIFNNIRFSNPSSTKEQVWDAIKFAQLDKFIDNLPKKEKTIVGERGVRLSGGEKQRVSIARAILANKKMLVLDEATSSLDSETEHEIQKDLGRLLEGRSSIIIAHRLSTIMNADRIIVMKAGKIIQQGSHEELINKEGEYKKLWNMQKGGYIE